MLMARDRRPQTDYEATREEEANTRVKGPPDPRSLCYPSNSFSKLPCA
jgi:hypothetical protein